MKKLFIFLNFLFFVFTNGQLIITEVYEDTPYNEQLQSVKKITSENPGGYINRHHRGEFVEIYNYSDTDIDLGKWYIKDYAGSFLLPNKIIKPGETMLIAYSPLKGYSVDFPELFPTTKGKEKQIIYQDRILLRNKKEMLQLYSQNFNGSGIPIESKIVSWHFDKEPASNHIHEITPRHFYEVQSMNLTANGTYIRAYPTPLEVTYRPATEKIHDIMRYRGQENYTILDWGHSVISLINNLCPINIIKEEQQSLENTTIYGKCFSYDDSGNYTSSIDCASTSSAGNTTTPSLTYDQLEQIKNDITIYPNPTRGEVTIKWENAATNKIYRFQVYSSSGNRVFMHSPNYGQKSITFNIGSQLPGVYVVNFTLNTGQVISKNLLKW